MDWIKWSKGLGWKPEVASIAAALGIDRWSAAARCMEVWEWADDHTANGNASSVTKSFIDTRAGIVGFAEAMEKVGWLTVKNDKIQFPNFDRHNSQTAKTRALTNVRVKRSRNARTVSNPLPEKRREEIHTPLAPQGGETVFRFRRDGGQAVSREMAEEFRKTASMSDEEYAAYQAAKTAVAQ